MSHPPSSPKSHCADTVILLLLISLAGFQVSAGFSRRAGRGGEPLSDMELAGLLSEWTPAPAMSPPLPASPRPPSPEILPKQKKERPPPAAEPAELSEKAHDFPLAGLDGEAATPSPEEKPPAPEAGSPQGIWVNGGRVGTNPIRVEDHVSVDAGQLAEMAGFRNISTDRRYAPPPFKISAVGTGRLGTYVIVEHQMIRLDGEMNAPVQPPRAWRLVGATASGIYWEPLEEP